MKRVVITGMGVVSPIGVGVENFWESILMKKSGVEKISRLDISRYKKRDFYVASLVKEDFKKEIEEYGLKNHSKSILYAILACNEALKQGDIKYDRDCNDISLILGTSRNSADVTSEIFKEVEGTESLSPEFRKKILNTRSSNLCFKTSSVLGLGGSSFLLPTACSSGNYSTAIGISKILNGDCNATLCGGVDSFSEQCFSIFYNLGAQSIKNKCKPFDKNRDGMIVGEGAGVVLLEELNHAKERNANILAEVKGFGVSCDAYSLVAPDPNGGGGVLSMNKALEMSNLSIHDIDYISAHGTGTPANDYHEAVAMHKIFGKTLENIPVSGLKSLLGHTMGASSSLETIAAVQSIKYQKFPNTANTNEIDDKFPIQFHVNTKKIKIKNVLNNAFAFGGNTCSLIISKYQN